MAVDSEKCSDFIVVVTAVMGAIKNVIHDNRMETLLPLSRRNVFEHLEVVYAGSCAEFEQECNLSGTKSLFFYTCI